MKAGQDHAGRQLRGAVVGTCLIHGNGDDYLDALGHAVLPEDLAVTNAALVVSLFSKTGATIDRKLNSLISMVFSEKQSDSCVAVRST
ncbi:hypothetical protein D9M71_832810 [compost metagenome]